MLDILDYNYKLRSMLGQEDDSTVTKWTWFNKQVHNTFLCSWIILRAVVDYTNIGKAIGRILDKVYVPSISLRDSIGSTTSFPHTLMVLHSGFDDHLSIRKFIHEGLLSS